MSDQSPSDRPPSDQPPSDRPISDYPIPPGPAGGHIRNFIARVRDTVGLFSRLQRDYGDIATYNSLGSKICTVFAPELIRQLLIDKRDSFEKGPGYKRSITGIGPSILTGDGDDHRRSRKLIQPAFGRRAMVGYATIMAEEIKKLEAGWQDGAMITIGSQTHRVMLNIATRAFFGSDNMDPALIRATMQGVEWGFVFSQIPFGRLLMRLPLRRTRRAHRVFAELDAVIQKLVDEARAAPQPRDDLLSRLARARDGDGVERPFTDKEIRDELYVILLAGHDTTSNALAWTFYYIARTPGVREKLELEIDTVLGDREPTLEDLPKLTYVDAVFDETIRLAPPVHFIGRRAIEECTLGPWRIPRGMVVVTWIMGPQRSEKYFPDPLSFKPERWLEPTPADRPKHAYFPFGGGNRNCIGGPFAKVEAVFALAYLLRRWRVEPVAKTLPEANAVGIYRIIDDLPSRLHKRRHTE